MYWITAVWPSCALTSIRPFPPMMLSTLVENASKHGFGPEGGLVRIMGTMARGELRVAVLDTGAGKRFSGLLPMRAV
jgi:LytS/YehU family sensor histidine kinase